MISQTENKRQDKTTYDGFNDQYHLFYFVVYNQQTTDILQ
jgi:hypothetical protein